MVTGVDFMAPRWDRSSSGEQLADAGSQAKGMQFFSAIAQDQSQATNTTLASPSDGFEPGPSPREVTQNGCAETVPIASTISDFRKWSLLTLFDGLISPA